MSRLKRRLPGKSLILKSEKQSNTATTGKGNLRRRNRYLLAGRGRYIGFGFKEPDKNRCKHKRQCRPGETNYPQQKGSAAHLPE